MASYCMLCENKIGFFSPWGEDILTGKSGNRLCEECYNKAEAIIKKIENKIPIEAEDYEGFSEAGMRLIKDHIELYGGIETELSEKSQEKREIEVGEATTNKLYEINEDETQAIFEKMKETKESEIEKFLEGIVSENDTADSFMREILSLTDENLEAVINEQRELYNNAQWAYILHVQYMRKAIDEAVLASVAPKSEPIEEDDSPLDEAELTRMLEKLSGEEKEALEEIISDNSYTKEAREAAKRLLEK